VGLFKSAKDLAKLTDQAKQVQRDQQQKAGYKPGMGGMMEQMGDMLGQANEQLAGLRQQSADEDRILAEGQSGEAVIVGMGTPARGAQRYNLDLDLEVHVGGGAPYRVANQYIVPASAQLGHGVRLPVKVDRDDRAKIAIDWQRVDSTPRRGEVRPVDGSGFAPAPSGSAGSPGPAGGDSIDELERLARLRDSGALTDAEFEQQKAKILGS
jgi:Short C-terminal domain